MPPVAIPTEAPSCLAVMGRALQPRRQTLILYSIDLRASSHGSASFSRKFARYEPMPENIAAKLRE